MNAIEKYLLEICKRRSARLQSEAARLRGSHHDPAWMDFLECWDRLGPFERDIVTLFVFTLVVKARIIRAYENALVWLAAWLHIGPTGRIER
jgi:hypothetical protein